MKVFYNDNYTASPEAFETTRKSEIIASDILRKESALTPNHKLIQLTNPSDVVRRQDVERLVESLHSEEYIDALRNGTNRNLAQSSGFEWGDTTYDFALAHSQGCVASIKTVLDEGGRAGTLSSGLHHASPTHGSGFCTVNGLAVASAYAVENGAKVMVLDFDAHCGGGTNAHIENMQEKGIIKKGDVVQIDMSVSGFDMYRVRDPHYLDLHHAETEDEYIDRIILALSASETRYEDGMVIVYNAGVDPVNTVDFDSPFSVIERREQLVSSWIADKPAIFTLAGGYKWGGYTMSDISKLHQLNIFIWASASERMKESA